MARSPSTVPTDVASAWLFVVSDDRRGRRYPLAATPVRIGRGTMNEIVTGDPHASRLHAEIRRQGERYLLRDCESTNGTRLNGDRVTEAELHDGDLIQIGAFSLVLQVGVAHDILPRAVPPGRAGSAAGGAVVDLHSRTAITVGRDPTNEMVLDHPQVSRHHARLELLPDGALAVIDLQSTNGTFADGQQVQGATSIDGGTTLTIGPFRLLFQDGHLIKGSEDGTIRIDCLHLSKTVAGGRKLLDDLTFSILPREFVSLVGGSGAGKSTLLDALSGVRPANGGEVRYNGADYYAQMDAYRSVIGYVPQDDIVPAELAVERALYYAAKLRLPPDMSEAEVRARVEEVLEDLGLTARRDVPIKNLSGGQRKRVSIGAELLAKPTLFFLDEPTSGLDPGLERRMMQLLRKLADQGRTVVLITHATQSVALCDNIAFLAPGGHLAYYGPPHEALDYFAVEQFADIYTTLEQETAMERWPRRFRQSPYYAEYVERRLADAGGEPSAAPGRRAAMAPAARVRAGSLPPAGRQASSLRQFSIVSQRYLETIRRDHKNLLTLLIQAPLIALMVAIVFRGPILDTTPLLAGGGGDNRRARIILFLLAMIAVWFGTSNSAREIVKEAAMYARERRINLRLAPYITSKFVVLTALSLVQNLILLAPLLLIGAGALHLPLLYAALVLGSVAGIGMGLTISAQATNPDRASSLVPIILIPQIIFSGVLVDLSNHAVGRAISYFMVTKWTYRALGATVNVDNIPVAKQLVRGLPPQLAPQLTGNDSALMFDGVNGGYYLLPVVPAEFDQSPLAYLALLALFIVASVALIAIFQRRKDVVR